MRSLNRNYAVRKVEVKFNLFITPRVKIESLCCKLTQQFSSGATGDVNCSVEAKSNQYFLFFVYNNFPNVTKLMS